MGDIVPLQDWKGYAGGLDTTSMYKGFSREQGQCIYSVMNDSGHDWNAFAVFAASGRT